MGGASELRLATDGQCGNRGKIVKYCLLLGVTRLALDERAHLFLVSFMVSMLTED